MGLYHFCRNDGYKGYKDIWATLLISFQKHESFLCGCTTLLLTYLLVEYVPLDFEGLGALFTSSLPALSTTRLTEAIYFTL